MSMLYQQSQISKVFHTLFQTYFTMFLPFLLLSYLIFVVSSIKMPLVQGEFRCMLVYASGKDQTIKLDINFPQITSQNNSAFSYYYYLTLRNTKTQGIQEDKIAHGHFRREISIFQNTIYEVCFELISNYPISQEVLVDYHAETHYIVNQKTISIPDHLLKVEHLGEIYENAVKVQAMVSSYKELQAQKTEEEQRQFKNVRQAETKIFVISVIEVMTLVFFGVYQFVKLKEKIDQYQYQTPYQ